MNNTLKVLKNSKTKYNSTFLRAQQYKMLYETEVVEG